MNAEKPSDDSAKVKKIINDIEGDEGVVNNRILKIVAEDVEVSHEEHSELQAAKEEKPTTFYSDLVYTLGHVRMQEVEARITWSDLIAHKWEMGKAMKRNVGIRVAALDYFQNVKQMVDDVRVIDSSHYIETKRLVVTDGLTGLFNHRYFYEKMTILSRQYNEGLIASIGLMVIDLDHFKQYNDANGHIAGDIVLMETANVFLEVLGEKGTAFRYGGEEFTVLVADATIRSMQELGEAVRAAVEKREFVNESVLPGGQVTVSIGISVFPSISDDTKHIFQEADEALYLAKKFGRNRVLVAEG